jgi:ABC-type oligopeptide transport system ATPase subunit
LLFQRSKRKILCFAFWCNPIDGVVQMSVKALTWAFEQPLAGNMKVVLLCLADHFNDKEEQCWPSINRLVERSCVSKSTVLRCLTSLEETGYIVVENRVRENGSKTSNWYRLNFDRVSQDVSGGVNLTPATPSVTADTTPSVTGDTTPSVTVDTTRTVIKNRKKEPLDISSDAEFDEFWAAYPKRAPHSNPKHPAKLKYVNARQRLLVPHEVIVNAAKAYAASVAGKNPEHIAQAQTWLNQRRWEEDCTPAADQADMDDVNLTELVKLYPGHVGVYPDVQAAVKSQLRIGATLDQICEAAKKYAQYLKELRYDGREIAPPMIETWLKFKWREMDAYEFARVGPDRRLTVRPKRKAK